MTTNRAIRYEAIQGLAHLWYTAEGERTEIPLSFSKLYTLIDHLATLGRGQAWINAIGECRILISTAINKFDTDNILPADVKEHTAAENDETHYTYNTRRDYSELFHWLLIEVTMTISYGNK